MFFKLQKEKQGQELIQEAKELGVVMGDIYPDRDFGASNIAEARLQERVRSAKNAQHARRTWIIALIAVIASFFIAFFAPWWQQEKKTEDEIIYLYRSIVANEDIFMTNSNNNEKFKNSTAVADLPESFIEYEPSGKLHDLLQKKLGIINYRFLLYYLEQTRFLNATRNQLVDAFITYDKSGDYFYQNAKRIYLETVDYLNKDKFDTKFNYFKDTGCLLYMLHKSFLYIKIDERNNGLNCDAETLDRKFYHFGFIPVDTPAWERNNLIEAVKYRIDITNSFSN